MKIGLISGHKIPGLLKTKETINVETNYGDVAVEISSIGKHDIFFINRHGVKANLPPQKINYLANIEALASSHVDCILAIGTVGSMKKNIKPGDFVIPDDFIDFTKTRPMTFFEGKRIHVDMTNPFCSSLRELLIKNGKKIQGTNVHEKGIYLITEGPRLETAAEIKFFSSFADIVGMTLAPEVILTREKGICYASLCVVCNMAAGLQNRLNVDEISMIYREKEPIFSKILQLTIESIDDRKKCNCKIDLSKATL